MGSHDGSFDGRSISGNGDGWPDRYTNAQRISLSQHRGDVRGGDSSSVVAEYGCSALSQELSIKALALQFP
jgi:hypothetical protein